jgi:hypothetical protein
LEHDEQQEIVTVFVKSKRVAVRSIIVEQYIKSVIGPQKVAERIVEYEDRLDETQRAMLEYANDLAKAGKFRLKIVDLSKQSRIKYSLGRLFGRPSIVPTIVFSDAIFCRVMKG